MAFNEALERWTFAPLSARSQSLTSIAETDEDCDDDDAPPSSENPLSSAPFTPFALSSSRDTTPDRIRFDDDGYPLRDSFSSALCSRLRNIPSFRSTTSTSSSMSSKMYYSPNSNIATPATRLMLKRSASPRVDKENVKRPRLIHRAQSNFMRSKTASEHDDAQYPIPDRSLQSRAASLRRADSLKSELIPTEPCSPVSRSKSQGVPVIAPPPDVCFSPPSTARTRIAAFLRREPIWRAPFRFDRVRGGVEVWDARLGLGLRVRQKVLLWIVEVEFPDEHITDDYSVGLSDQLDDPETRFHAAYLFLIFAFKLGWTTWNAWDVATACVSLSAKYHHDFLAPLHPIVASDILYLPMHEMTTHDLERNERLILNALNYCIGATTIPGGIIDELWSAIPGAQDIFSAGEWKEVLTETWRLLLVTVVQPDVLQFSIALLTAAAVIDASQTVLSWRRAPICEDNVLEGLVYDLEAVLDLRAVELSFCRDWLSEVVDAAEGL